MFHACDIQIGCVLNQLTKFVTPFARIHQVIKAASVLGERAYIQLGLALNLIFDVTHEISDRGATSSLKRGVSLIIIGWRQPLCYSKICPEISR